MAPSVWVYTNDYATLRAVQRDTDEGTEVLVVGSQGERVHHTFSTRPEACAFRQTLQQHICRRGFALKWSTGPTA
jgi:hypothetical protein